MTLACFMKPVSLCCNFLTKNLSNFKPNEDLSNFVWVPNSILTTYSSEKKPLHLKSFFGTQFLPKNNNFWVPQHLWSELVKILRLQTEIKNASLACFKMI